MASKGVHSTIGVIVFGALVALALVLAAGGHAGSQGSVFPTPLVAPNQLSTGQTGLAGAKFTPQGTSNSGSATHVVISLQFPSDSTNIAVTACPGTVGYVGTTATCSIQSIQNGNQVKMFATFTAGAAGAQEVDGLVTWDKPSGNGGSTGGTNTTGVVPSLFTIDAPTSTQQGKCTTIVGPATDSIGGFDPATGKTTTVTYASVDGTFGFPCTPAQAGVKPSDRSTSLTKGDWMLLVPPLAGGALAQAVLTINSLPSGTNAKKFQIYELGADGTTVSSTPVPACTSTGALPVTDPPSDSCIYNRTNFGKGGVALYLHVQGSTIDPSYTG
jgi:hypothetical protein